VSANTVTVSTRKLFLGFLALLFAWSISSAPAAVPDEPAHLVMAQGVWRGDLSSPMDVPNTPTALMNCYAGVASQSISCASAPWNDDVSPHVTPADSYPPFYHLLVGWGHFFGDGEMRGYAVRWAAVLLSAIVLSVALRQYLSVQAGAVLRASRGSSVSIGFVLLCCTPAACMYMSSVNPSGLTFSSALAVWIMIGTIRMRGSFVTADAALLSTFSTLLILSRRDSLLWVAFIATAGLVLLLPIILRSLRQDLLVGAPFALPVIATWYQLSNVGGTLANQAVANVGATGNAKDIAWWMSTQYSRYFEHMTVTLGWLDTGLPPILNFLVSIVYGGLILMSVATSRSSALLASTSLLYSIAVPIVLITFLSFGYYQGRYSLPVLPGILIALLITGKKSTPDKSDLTLNFIQPKSLFFLSFCIQFIMMWQFIRRNSIGLGGSWNIYSNLEWTPLLGQSLPLILLIASHLTLFSAIEQDPSEKAAESDTKWSTETLQHL